MIGYGSSIELEALDPSQIGKIYKTENKLGIAVLRTLITVGEIGLSFVPGVGTLAQTGIALAAAGANTAIDASQNQLSGTGIGLNFGSALIPGATKAVSGARKLGKFNRNIREGIKQAESYIQQATELGLSTLKTVEAGTAPRFLKSALDLQKEVGLQSKWIKDVFAPDKLLTKLRSQTRLIFDSSAVGGIRIGSKYNIKFALDTLQEYSPIVRNTLEAVEGEEEDIRKTLNKAGVSKQDLVEITRLTNGYSGAQKNSMVVAYLVEKYGADGATKLLEGVKRSRRIKRYLDRIFGESRKEMLAKQAATLQKINDDFALLDINKLGKVKSYNLSKEKPYEFTTHESLWKRWVKAVKSPSSNEFNDMVVQPTQAIFDAGDLGRAPIEAAYKKLSKYFSKYFKRLGKVWNKVDKLEDIFVKEGGILINSSVIMGYKVINDVANQNLVQINFYKETTGARNRMWNGKASKNFGGKKPVFVQATDRDLKRLKEQGMRFYLKRWALSRGGKPIGISSFGWKGLAEKAELMLPFINTTLLRNMLSLGSNVIDNLADTITGVGGWSKGWTDKFAGSFKRNFTGRLGRLLGRSVIGGVAGARFGSRVGLFVGKEAQRVLGAVTNSINYSIAHPNQGFGEAFSKQFKRQVVSRAQQAAKSHMNRRLRHTKPGVVSRQSQSVKRKLEYLRRVPGSAAPGRINFNKKTRF